MTHFNISILLLILCTNLNAQNNFEVSGYVKNMHSVMVLPENPLVTDRLFSDNLIHHRFNTICYINNKLSLRTELRDRIIYGDLLENYSTLTFGQDYSTIVDAGNDQLDLSFFMINNTSLLWHIIADRMYFEYISGNWEVRAGRQRINWGINTFWNPNDIFNAFNYFDFDYEERPGADALRLTYYKGISTSYEFALKYFDKFEDATGAFLMKTTKWNTDLQSIIGKDKKDLVFGGGLNGYIKGKYGLKAEASLFQPYESLDSTSTFVMSLGTDYITKKEWIWMLGVLYNEQNGVTNANPLDFTSNNNISAKSLAGTEWNIILSVAKAINPRSTWSTAIMYSPEGNTSIAINSFSYSLKDNWDIDMISQIMAADSPIPTMGWIPMFNATFLRLKVSY